MPHVLQMQLVEYHILYCTYTLFSILTQTFPFKIPITRQARPHDFATQSVVNTAQRQKSNKLIMMGAVAFMLIGATVQYFFIRYMSHM